MSTPAQPTWGNGGRALTRYDQLDCVMLNVMGEGIPSARPDMPATRPENWDQNKICSYVYPGTYSIPTSINQTTIELSVSVQKGPARLVQLIGFKKPAALRCEDITLPMMMSGGVVTERHELGKTKVDLMSDTTVEIQGNIASAKLIDGCRGLQNGGGPSSYVAFNDNGLRLWDACQADYAEVYLYKKKDGSSDFTGAEPRRMASARVSCSQVANQPSLVVSAGNQPYYNGALGQLGAETAIGQGDSLALELRWFTQSGGGSETGTSVVKEARYDVQDPTFSDTPLIAVSSGDGTANPAFFVSFANLSEGATFRIIQSSTCSPDPYLAVTKSLYSEKMIGLMSLNFPPTTGSLSSTSTNYQLYVHDSAGNGFCPASITYAATPGGSTYLSGIQNTIPPIGRLQTEGGMSWSVSGMCNTNYVDTVQLLNDQNSLVDSTPCQSGGFTISATGTPLAGDGLSGQKTFMLRALKGVAHSGSDLTLTVTRDLEYPGVTSASLTTSDAGIANPSFTINLQGASEAATILLLRGDTTCQAATTVGSSSIVAGQQSFNQTFLVTAPQGTSRYFIGIKDAAGNLNCPDLDGLNQNFLEYTNS
jgi:hypothetical protein